MTTVALTGGTSSRLRKIFARSGWVIGVWLLLGGLLLWYSTLIPRFGEFQVVSITKNSLPLAYLAIGQGIIVIAGGIDLSLGALLLLSNVIAARFMEDQPLGIVLGIAVLLILAIAALNSMTGYIITISRVPDIVVTLAMSYIWSGVALWILPSPGGGTAPQMRWLFTGAESGIGGTWIMPVLMMAIPTAIVYYISKHTRLGLSLYAVGSDDVASRLAGIDVRHAKVYSYAIGGAMAAHGRAGHRGHHRHRRSSLQRRRHRHVEQCGRHRAGRRGPHRRRRLGAGRCACRHHPRHVEPDSDGHGHQPQQCAGHPGRADRRRDDGRRHCHPHAGASVMTQSAHVDNGTENGAQSPSFGSAHADSSWPSIRRWS